MVQEKSDGNASFEQLLKQVDALAPDERGRLYTHLQFRIWDEDCNKLRQQLNDERAAKGLPAASDEDVHDSVAALRTPDDWEDLRHELQKGLDQLDAGEGIPAERVFAELRQRYNARKKT